MVTVDHAIKPTPIKKVCQSNLLIENIIVKISFHDPYFMIYISFVINTLIATIVQLSNFILDIILIYQHVILVCILIMVYMFSFIKIHNKIFIFSSKQILNR